jgi:thiol-disulfide isomerase/thioredoxin/uncharacterized membrane protein YphA (DoxX/SURF4 family)
MSSVELLLRVGLSLIFLTSGAAKLADLKQSRETLVAFGVSEKLSEPFGTALPMAELLIAVALLLTPLARWGAAAAVILLLIFCGGIAYALSQGRAPDCNCFGVVSSEQITGRTLARNGGLIVVAGLAVWKAPGSSLTHWTQNASAANLVAALAILGLALAMVLVAHTRQMLLGVRSELAQSGSAPVRPGLQPGVSAPRFEIPTLDGGVVSLTSLLERHTPVLLVFASQHCGPCMQMLPDLVRWSETLEERLTFALIESDVPDAPALSEEIARHGTILTLLDDGRTVQQAYEVNATPTAVLVGADGFVAAHQTSGAGNIELLVRRTLDGEFADPQPVA